MVTSAFCPEALPLSASDFPVFAHFADKLGHCDASGLDKGV